MKFGGIAAIAVLGLAATTVPGTAGATSPWQEESLPAPSQGGHGKLLTTMAGPDDTFALGSASEESGKVSSLAYQRGADGWRQIDFPDVGEVSDVQITGTDDGWAVGSPALDSWGGSTPVRWDGSAWKPSKFAVPDSQSFHIKEMTATGSDDVWAVGAARPADDDYGPNIGTIQHWDGSAWQNMPVPEIAGSWGLKDVDALAPDDIWAIGYTVPADSGPRSISLHWDGKAWTPVEMPPVEVSNQMLTVDDIEAVTPNDVWASGTKVANSPIGTTEPVMYHFDGTTWAPVEVPNEVGQRTELVQHDGSLYSLGDQVMRLTDGRWSVETTTAGGQTSGGTTLRGTELLTVGSTEDGSAPFAQIKLS